MDRELRVQLLRAAVRDRAFLKQAWHDLRPQDFPEREESLVAQAAVSFYEKFEEPVGVLLRAEVDSLTALKPMGAEAKDKLKNLITKIQGTKMELVSVKALIGHAKALKRYSFYTEGVDEILTAHEKGELTAEVLAELVEKANKELNVQTTISHDYFSDSERDKRLIRRANFEGNKYPMLMIQPLDSKIRIIGRGQLAIWLAPPSGGKGLALLHTACAYVLQGLKVLFVTLEDPLDLVEDRLDASLTGISLHKLQHLPKKLKKRFTEVQAKARGRLKIVDGTDGGWTVTRLERLWEQEARDGFQADVIIVDYDDELECEKQFKGENQKRFEFSEIYKRLRKLASKTHTIVWTAAQTTRGGMGRRIITGKDIAEDFSKIRKVFLAIGIGQDPDEENVRYLYVIKHRLDRKGFGVEIVSNYDSAVFYDMEDTQVRLHTQANNRDSE